MNQHDHDDKHHHTKSSKDKHTDHRQTAGKSAASNPTHTKEKTVAAHDKKAAEKKRRIQGWKESGGIL